MTPTRYASRPAYFLLSALVIALVWVYFYAWQISLLLFASISFIVGTASIYISSKFWKKEKDPENAFPWEREQHSPDLLFILKYASPWVVALLWTVLLIAFGTIYGSRINKTSEWKEGSRYTITERGQNRKGMITLTLTPIAERAFIPRKIYATVRNSSLEDSLLYREGNVLALSTTPYNLFGEGALESNSFRIYLKGEGYLGYAWLSKSDIKVVVRDQQKRKIADHFKYYREQIIFKTEQMLEEVLSPSSKSLFYALCLGYKNENYQDVRTSFSASGVAHILAISGFHLGVIASCLLWLLRRIMPQYQYRSYRYLFAIPLLLCYALFTGASPSTMRAFVMIAFLLLYKGLNRKSDPLQIWSGAVFVMLLISPHYIFNMGFLLSISAVWGILHFYPFLKKLLKPENPLLVYLFNMLWISIAAHLGIWAWLSYFTGEWSLVFLWSNVPVTIVATIAIVLGLLLVLSLPFFPFLIPVLGWALNRVLEALTSITSFFASVPGLGGEVTIGIPTLLLYYSTLFILFKILEKRAAYAV